MIKYKLTDKNLQTHDGFQWTPRVWVFTDGQGPLCTSHWLHCYDHPLLALLHNPIHTDIKYPLLWECEVGREELRDGQMKSGWTAMRIMQEIPIPTITTVNRVAYGILCSMSVYPTRSFLEWANKWLTGEDRTQASSRAAVEAAWAEEGAAEAREAAARAAEAWAERAAAWAAEAWAERAAASAAAWASEAWAAERAAEAWAAERAAEADDKELNLIKIAEKAMEYK